MTTRNIVPRANGEGGIGTASKKWGTANIQTLNADLANLSNVNVDGLNVNGLNPFWLLLQRNKAYSVGDIAYSSNLSSWAYLECATAGTTGAIEPSFSSFQQGSVVNDGSCVWVVNDMRDSVTVGDVVFRPYVKTGYLQCNGQQVNRATYPRLAAFATSNNLWTSNQTNEPWKFGNGNGSTTMTVPNYLARVIQGGSTTAKLEAGLPNIVGGTLKSINAWWNEFYNNNNTPTQGQQIWNGASGMQIENSDRRDGPNLTSNTSKSYFGSYVGLFNASRSNPIYGKSGTVQPPAIQLIPQIKY